MHKKRMIPVLMMLFIATALMVSTAAGATATRTLPSSVSPGEELTVNIAVSDYGIFGYVEETLPADFTFVSSTMDESQVTIDGQTIIFTLFGDDVVSYTVAAAGSEGTYQFAGIIGDEDKIEFAVGGATATYVEAGGASEPPVEEPPVEEPPVDESESPASSNASAVRTLPASVTPGEVFTVSMAVSDYGMFGNVVETLPAGFTFVDSTLDAAQVVSDPANDTVQFLLLNDVSFDYTVMASGTEGAYVFSGIIQDEDQIEVAVTGDESISVAVTVASATRTLPASITSASAAVEPGDVFTVSMAVSDYGMIGNVVETLPVGFTYVGSTLDTPQVIPNGNTVMFLLLNDNYFEYTVMASDIEGTYAFSGVLQDENQNEFAVVGDSAIAVETYVAPPVVVVNDVPLDMGWNFISVPGALENPGVNDVLAGVSYDALMYYNAQTSVWEPVSEFEPLKGYWIHVTAENQVILEDSLASKVYTAPPAPQTIQLYAGWNAIGYTDEEACLSAELTLLTIDASYETIWGAWDPVSMSYEYYGHNNNVGVISGNHVGTDIFEMCPYEGYWVYLTQDDVLSAVGN